MNKSSIRKLTLLGLLSAIAFVLYFIEFPLPPFPPFLQIDLSDIPAIIAAFSMGPISAVAIELVKNVLHFFVKGTTAGIGEMANFTCGSIFVIVTGLIYKTNKNIKTAIVALAVAAISMALVMSVLNYYILIPLYSPKMPMNDVLALIKTAIFPFNLIKGIIIGFISILTFKGLQPIINKFAMGLNKDGADLQ